MERCLLFVYGLLQPGQRPPQTMSRSWPATVFGELYDLGPYPGVVKIDQCARVVHGWVIEIEEAELAALDEFEGVGRPDTYRRIRTTTADEHQVWIYEFIGPLPAGPALDRWPIP